MMQSSTKALAQMLAGNTKMSGQLVHARGVLAQANRMVDERMPDRLPPAAREQFFEQLAFLKLTIADAEDASARPRRARAGWPSPRSPWTPSDCATSRVGWPRADPAPPAPRRRPPADEELDDLPGPGNVTSGYALSPARQAAEEQTAGDVTGTGPAS